MTDPNKDEILAMAREAGCAWLHEPLAQRFATLCRASLVAENAALKQAHEINADTLNAMQVEIDDWKARALKAEQAGESTPNDVVAGALYDFLGYLTSRRTRVTMSDRDEAGPAVDALVDWSKTRKITLEEARVEDWQNYTTPPQPAAQEPTSAPPVVEQLVEALERKLPGGKQTDDFESSRIGDYNQGWNDYRKAVKKMFKNINMNSSENSNPDAYLYSLEYGEKVVDTKVSIHQLNYPFGVAGADYLVRNDDGVSYVRQTKLYAALAASPQEQT